MRPWFGTGGRFVGRITFGPVCKGDEPSRSLITGSRRTTVLEVGVLALLASCFFRGSLLVGSGFGAGFAFTTFFFTTTTRRFSVVFGFCSPSLSGALLVSSTCSLGATTCLIRVILGFFFSSVIISSMSYSSSNAKPVPQWGHVSISSVITPPQEGQMYCISSSSSSSTMSTCSVMISLI